MDEDWIEFDLKAVSTIQLCFADEVLYNSMGYDRQYNYGTRETLHDKIFDKSAIPETTIIYTLLMKEGTSIHAYLNSFNGILCQLLSIGVKIEEEDKTLILLAFLPLSFKHLVTMLL